MTTSGNVVYSQTRNEVILDAYNLLGIYGLGRTVSAEDMALASRFLNKMIKSWSTKGLNLWAKDEGVLYLTPSVGKYNLGVGSTTMATTLNDQIITKLSGNIALGATSITVDSTTGMTIGDHIGIVLPGNTIHWTTIATIPTSTTLTLTVGVPAAAYDDTLVYTFTTRINKPMRILDARLVSGYDNGTTSSQIEQPMTSIAYQEYFEIGMQTANGLPNQFHYNPQQNYGIMYIWPRAIDPSYRVHFTFERMLENVDNIADTLDFPDEWLEPLTWQLATRLGPAFGKDAKVNNSIYPLAVIMLENLLSWNNEITEVSIHPDIRDY